MNNRRKLPFPKQKIHLYFDANFPKGIVDELRSSSSWKRKCKIRSVFDDGFEEKDDEYIYNYCRKKGYTLVTLDKDFMDDIRFPFSTIPGIIRVVSAKNDIQKIRRCLSVLLDFLSKIPFPRIFIGDTKFIVNIHGCVIRGRDTKTREIKTIKVRPGDEMIDVLRKFHY